MRRPHRIARAVLFLALLIPAPTASSTETTESPLGCYIGRITVPSGKTTEVAVKFHLRSSEPLGSTTVKVSAADSHIATVLTPEFRGLAQDGSWTMRIAVSPRKTVLYGSEEIEIEFEESSRSFSHFVSIRITPVPWFWPLIGLSVGTVAILVFVLLFRRITGGD